MNVVKTRSFVENVTTMSKVNLRANFHLPRKVEFINFPARQLMHLFAFGLLLFTIYHMFSPWKLVIEIRSTSDPSNTRWSSETSVAAELPAQESLELQEPNRKQDYIENNFGDLEETFLKSIGGPSDPPKRSRDDSIKQIYGIQSPSDWLDLVEGHDDHVCYLLFYYYFTLFDKVWLGSHGSNKNYATLYP
jgi:hypothetical protein